MLRPATPLSIFFFVAFILLLLSTISVPVVKSIPLGSANIGGIEYLYGVFGFCMDNVCQYARVGTGYDLKNVPNSAVSDLSRHRLSNLLIVHPIAAFLTLVCTIMAVSAHFRTPAHSPRFLLALLITSFPTLFITLLAFLVDILLFIPDMEWGGWVVLVATIILTTCTVLTCAMRRTLVNRKARKARIQQNAEMNGENYYAQRAEEDRHIQMKQMHEMHLTRAETPPPLDSKYMNVHDLNKTPEVATFEYDRSRPSTEHRNLLGSGKAPSQGSSGNDGYTDHPNGAVAAREHSRTRLTPRDNYREGRVRDDISLGNSVSPIDDERSRYHQSSLGSPDSRHDPRRGAFRGGPVPPYRGRGGPPPPLYGRGRGGYPPPRGYGPPRGGGAARGMYSPPRGGRGYRHAPGSRGGPAMGPSPPDWYDGDRGRHFGTGAVAGGMAADSAAMILPQNGRQPPPDYRNRSHSEGSAPYPTSGDSVVNLDDQQSRNHADQRGYYEDDLGRRQSDEQLRRQEQQDVAASQWPGNDPYTRRPSAASSSSSQRTQRLETFGALGEQPPLPVRLNPGSSQQNDQNVQPPLSQQQTTRPTRPLETIRSPESFGFSGRRPSPVQSANRTPRSQSPPPPLPTASIPAQDPSREAYEVDTTDAGGVVDPRVLAKAYTQDPHDSGATSPNNLENNYSAGNQNSPSTRHPQSDSAAELHTQAASDTQGTRSRKRKSSDAYYEDVSPRFATEEQNGSSLSFHSAIAHEQPNIDNFMHSMLTPGGGSNNGPSTSHVSSMYSDSRTNDTNRNETRSPAISEGSNFTSISQRGVNPNWHPPPQVGGPLMRGGYGGGGPAFAGVSRSSGTGSMGNQRRWKDQDVILSSNPDFGLPGHASGGSGGKPGHSRGLSGSHHYPDAT